MSVDASVGPVQEPGRQPRRRRWVRAAVPILLLAVAAASGVALARPGGTGQGRSPGHELRTAAPLELHTVADEVADHYRFAADHRDVHDDIPCYCGCEDFLAHRDLYDCFVRRDGRGWDSHAAGCGVCIAEAAVVRDLSGRGLDPADIRRAVVAQFASVPPTTVPST